jgi:hypothetical protein
MATIPTKDGVRTHSGTSFVPRRKTRRKVANAEQARPIAHPRRDAAVESLRQRREAADRRRAQKTWW